MSSALVFPVQCHAILIYRQRTRWSGSGTGISDVRNVRPAGADVISFFFKKKSTFYYTGHGGRPSVDYATRMERLNDISDEVETRDPIDSSQLSYAELKETQVNRATDHENRACSQWGIENTPALNSTPLQHVGDDVIHIQLLYDPNAPTEPELWDGSFHPISLHGSLEHLASDAMNIKDSLNSVARYISNKQIDPKWSNNIQDFKGVGEVVWNLTSVYQSN